MKRGQPKRRPMRQEELLLMPLLREPDCVECPRCGAPPQAACVTPCGKPARKTHERRHDANVRARREARAGYVWRARP